MTLISSIITSKWTMIVCDNRHSIESNDGSNTQATITIPSGAKINITAPRINIDSNTKIYQINENLYISGAGDFQKIKNYRESLEKEMPSDITKYTIEYFFNNKETSPDYLMINQKLFESYTGTVFIKSDWKESNLFQIQNISPLEKSFSTLSIGSGNSILQPIFQSYKKELDKFVSDKLSVEEQQQKFENFFVDVFKIVAKYDNSVSSSAKFYKF